MSNKTNISVILVTALCSLLLAFSFPASAADDQPLPLEEKVKSLLPVSDDLHDEDEIARLDELIAMGDIAYPALAHMLEDETEPVMIGRICGVFIESEGDKTIPIEAVKRLLTRDENVKVLTVAARTLGHIGGVGDTDALFPFLRHEDEYVRVNTIRALAKIGDEKTADTLSAAMEERKAGLTPVERDSDMTLIEGDAAVTSLRNRLDRQEQR